MSGTLYVAIEGLKGSGKSTLVSGLCPALKSNGVEARLLSPTAPTSVLNPLEFLTRMPWIGNWDPIRERLYAHRSNYHARRLQGRCATQGQLLLGDRSILTTVVTRWERARTIGIEKHYSRCRKLEPLIPIPDHVVMLRLPVDQLLRRVRPRARRYGIRDEQLPQLRAALDGYGEIRRNPPGELGRIVWHDLDAGVGESALVSNALTLINDLYVSAR